MLHLHGFVWLTGNVDFLNPRETHAATLAAKTFRIMMAITAFFDLDRFTQQ
jgi:hypothetical protein